MQQRFVQTGRAIDVSDFKELCFRITEIFISDSSEASMKASYCPNTCPYDTESCGSLRKFSTAEIKRKLPIRFSYDEVTLALTELVRIRALDEHVVKGKLFYSRR
jgi:hypothetical protein